VRTGKPFAKHKKIVKEQGELLAMRN